MERRRHHRPGDRSGVGAISCVGRLRTRQPDRDRRVNGRALGASRCCGEAAAASLCGSSVGAFVALAMYLAIQSTVVLVAGFHPRHSMLGIVWTAVTAVAMFLLEGEGEDRRSSGERCAAHRGSSHVCRWHPRERGAARSRAQRCTRLVVGRSGRWLRPRLLRCSRSLRRTQELIDRRPDGRSPVVESRSSGADSSCRLLVELWPITATCTPSWTSESRGDAPTGARTMMESGPLRPKRKTTPSTALRRTEQSVSRRSAWRSPEPSN